MLNFLERLFAKSVEDVRIELPTAEIVFNHRLKLAFLYLMDAETSAESFTDMEKHLAKKGYYLHVFIPSHTLTTPPRPQPSSK